MRNLEFSDAYSIVEYYKRQLDKPVENYAGYMSTKVLDEFSIQLVKYRKEHQLNQSGLAKELGITQPMVSQYESGTSNITVKRLCEICEKIGVRQDGVRVSVEYEDASNATVKDS